MAKISRKKRKLSPIAPKKLSSIASKKHSSSSRVQNHRNAFHDNIMLYLKQNASPKVLLKLMQCSKKYFCYKEFPYMVLNHLVLTESGSIVYNPKSEYDCSDRTSLNIKKAKKKFWICEAFAVWGSDVKIHSVFYSKIVVCDIKKLELSDHIITKKNFELLTSSGNVETFYCCRSQIRNEDGSLIPLEENLSTMPKLGKLNWYLNDVSVDSFSLKRTETLLQVLTSLPLKELSIYNAPEKFDFSLLVEYMNQNPSICYYLNFYQISFKHSIILQKYVDQFIASEEYKSRNTIITFPWQSNSSLHILKGHANRL